MATHLLKIDPINFEAVANYEQNFQVRKNDRNYQVGDVLVLQEYCRVTRMYGDKAVVRTVNCMTTADSTEFKGIAKGYVILGIRPF